MVSWCTYFFMYDMCTWDINYGFLVYLVLHVWHVYIRSFLLNYGFLVSTWSFMYDMCTSDLSFWTMVSWSLPGPSCMTCVHQIFPSELWFLGLYLVLHVWHVYIRSFLLNYGFLVSTWSFMYDMCTSDLSFWTMVSWSLPGPSCMTCVHQIFPSELWFLVYLVLHVWHVYIRSFLLNYGFLVSTWSFMYDMCTSDLSFWTMVSWSTWSFMYDMCTSDLSFWTMVSWSLPGPSCMTCVHQIFPSELWFLGVYMVLHVWHVYIRSFLLNYGFLVSTWFFMYDMCTSDLSFWTNYLVLHVWHVYIRSFFLNYGFLFYLVLHVWHVYIRSFLLNYGFLVSTWSFMYDMCTSDLSFWTMVSWSLPGHYLACMTCVHQIFPSELWFLGLTCSSCMTCVHQIFPSELWFLGLYLVLHVWHVYIRSFLLNYGFLVSTCMTCVHQIFIWTMVSWSLPGPSCMTCVHQIFPSELWFLGLYLVLHVWHVYIRSFLLNYGFLVYLVLHVWHVYIRSFLLNYGFLVSTWSFMYDMCTSDLSFWTMVSWSLPGPSCMTCVHQIFPSELWFLGLYLVLHVWHVYIRSFLLNYGFLVSTWSFMYDMCTSDLSFWTMVSWSLPGPSCMTCVHQIFPSELWFLGLYLVLHVWHVYIRSFLLNYGFLSTWSFMYDMCTSDLSFWTMVSWSLPGSSCMTCVHQIFPSELWFLVYLVLHVWHVYIRSFLLNYGFLVSTWSFMYDMCTSDLSFWTMVSWSLPGPSCMTCVHQIFPSELWFLGLYLVLHVWHVYIRSFLLNYGFLVSTWSFMYDMCTSDLSFWTMVSWSLPGPSCMTCVHQIFPSELWFLGLYLVFMYDMCTSDLSFWTMVSWSLPGSSCMTCVHQIFPSELWFLGLYLVLHVWHVYIRSFSELWFLGLPGPSCMTCVHQIFPSELWFLGLYLVLHV